MHLDDIFKVIGEFGPYQKKIFFLLCITAVITSMNSFSVMLTLYTPKYRCNFADDGRNVFLHNDSTSVYYETSGIEDHRDCLINSTDADSHCEKFLYDKAVFVSTFTSENNLVCRRSYLITHMQMVRYLGGLVAGFVQGVLSDYFGRKKTICLSAFVLLCSGIGIIWSPNYLVFMILKFWNALANSSLYNSGFVMGLEIVGPSKRRWAGGFHNYCFATGLTLLSGVGFLLRHWIYIELACTIPALLVVFYCGLIPESPRWLISKKRYDEARVTLRRFAKASGTPEMFGDNMRVDTDEQSKSDDKILHLLRSSTLMKYSTVIFFNWFVVGMGYVGLSLNTENLSGSFFLNLFISGILEIPAYTLCIFLIDFCGRKKLHIICMAIGGLSLLCTMFTTWFAKDIQGLTVALAMIGRFGVTTAYATIYIWTAELYPTFVRNSGVGLSATCAAIGGVVSPYFLRLTKIIPGEFGKVSPLLVFGACVLCGGVLSVMLPETLGRNLPETIAQAECHKKNIGNLRKADEEINCLQPLQTSVNDRVQDLS